jgi:uncharacterized membrane protein YdjX (TVP38/TMEM64 family)
VNSKIKFITVAFGVLTFFFVFFLNYKEILNLFLDSKELRTGPLFVYILFNFIFFLTPMPTTIMIIVNGFLFKETGFIISYFFIIFDSMLIFIFSNKLINFFKKNFKNNKIYKLSKKKFSVFISRFIIPYFFHNLYYGLTDIKLSKFMIIIILCELPLTYAFNSIGMSLNVFTFDQAIDYKGLFTDKNFYLPILVIILVILLVKFFEKKEN